MTNSSLPGPVAAESTFSIILHIKDVQQRSINCPCLCRKQLLWMDKFWLAPKGPAKDDQPVMQRAVFSRLRNNENSSQKPTRRRTAANATLCAPRGRH